MTSAPALVRPLPLRLLLDEAVRQARRHFRSVYPAVAVPLALAAGAIPLAQVVFIRAVAGGAPSVRGPAAAFAGFGAFAAVTVAFMVVYALGYGALLVAALDAVAGRPTSMVRAWGFLLRPRAFGTVALTMLGVLVGFVLCVLPGIYLGLLLAFTVPVMAEEGLFGPGALRRSAELTRYNPGPGLEGDPRLKVFLILFVGTLLGYVVSMTVQMPLIVVMQVMMFRRVAGGQNVDPAEQMVAMTWLQVPSQILGMLANTAVHLYISFGLALLFFDVKRRKEGLDLEAAIGQLLEARAAEGPPP
jgi:hypothetical protein